MGKLHNFPQMLAQQLPVKQPGLMADGLRHEESSGSLFCVFILSMTEEEEEEGDEDEEEEEDDKDEEDKDEEGEEEDSRANCTWLTMLHFCMHFRGCSISDFLEMKLLLHLSFFWPRLKVIHCSHLLMEQLLRSRGSRPSTNNSVFFLYCQSYHYQHYLHLTLSCHSFLLPCWR